MNEAGAQSARRTIAVAPERAPEAIARAAEEWGARWWPREAGGRLELPVTAGVRRGVVTGELEVVAEADATLLAFYPRDAVYRLNWTAVLILLFGALGALGATLWPFFPPLLSAAPLAIVLALSAWFLVAARIRSSTPDDFLELVEFVALGPDASA